MNMITSLQHRLDQRADAKTKAWWERYLKHVIPFRGVKMVDIRAVLHQWVRDEGIDRLPVQEQKELALDLMRLAYTEDKLASILFWQEILLPAGEVNWPDDLPRFAELFQQGFIYDWNTCDWFCVRELSLADQARVVAFVEERIGQFTREGLAYATEKMPADTQARLNALHTMSRNQAAKMA
jgi:hypothetical protein